MYEYEYTTTCTAIVQLCPIPFYSTALYPSHLLYSNLIASLVVLSSALPLPPNPNPLSLAHSSSSILSAFPSHFNLFSLIFSTVSVTPHLLLISSFLIRSYKHIYIYSFALNRNLAAKCNLALIVFDFMVFLAEHQISAFNFGKFDELLKLFSCCLLKFAESS